MRKILFCAVLGLFFTAFIYSVIQKEDQLAHGEIIILKMAPADPRSLMQGDYMRIHFVIADQIREALKSQKAKSEARDDRDREGNSKFQEERLFTGEGYAVIAADKEGIMQFVRLDDGGDLSVDERRMFYRLRNEGVQIASNSFFFQEGHGKAYEKEAVFAELRLDKKGHPLIRHLLNKEKKVIQHTPDAVKQ